MHTHTQPATLFYVGWNSGRQLHNKESKLDGIREGTIPGEGLFGFKSKNNTKDFGSICYVDNIQSSEL